MQFQKQDMEGTHYRWAANSEKQIFTGLPTRRVFDRFNGDQVLFLINVYASEADNFTPDDGRKIEHDIYNNLPLDAKSEISVFNWIKEECLSENKPGGNL